MAFSILHFLVLPLISHSFRSSHLSSLSFHSPYSRITRFFFFFSLLFLHFVSPLHSFRPPHLRFLSYHHQYFYFSRFLSLFSLLFRVPRFGITRCRLCSQHSSAVNDSGRGRRTVFTTIKEYKNPLLQSIISQEVTEGLRRREEERD